MSYFIIKNNFRAKGVTEESYTFVSDIFDKKDTYNCSQSWISITGAELAKMDLPDFFYLISPGRGFYLDYASYGPYSYIVSDDFKQLIDTFKIPKYIAKPLKVVNKKGDDISKGRKYWWLFFVDRLTGIIDREKTTIKVDQDKLNFDLKYYKEISNTEDLYQYFIAFEKVVYLENIPAYDIFEEKNSGFIMDMICTEALKAEIEKRFSKTIVLKDVKDYTKNTY